MREKRRESKRRIRGRRSPRETFLLKWHTLHSPLLKWYEVKVCRITSKMNATEYDEFYAKYFPKTARDKEIEEWREKRKQKELEQMSPEEREALNNFWEAFEKEEARLKNILKNRKAMSIVE
jgi:hypothetical protein